nr:protein ddi1 2 [Hymenolepis microstoma]
MSQLRLMISFEVGAAEADLTFFKNNKALPIESTNTVVDCGLADEDMISVRIKGPGASNPSRSSSSLSQNSMLPIETVEILRQQLLNLPPAQLESMRNQNPRLYDALHDREAFYRISQNFQEPDPVRELVNADPFDPEVQRKIEELIHESNINREMEAAVENYPETFGQVSMLYVACEVNGHPVKAFVDSGAQITLMSLECARRCNLERLIDKRFQGMAYGVGSQKIIGRVHQAMLKFDNTTLPTSFLILDQQMEIMIGLDMLKRHRCCINLAENVLQVGDYARVPFLPESELPHFAKISPERGAQPGASSTEQNFSEEQLSKVELLTSQNVPRDRAIALLEASNWDPDVALVKYISSLP